VAFAASVLIATAVQAADASKYVAPFYPRAVSGVVGKAPGAKVEGCPAAILLSKDSIDKVKAFYDKAVGPLKQTPQPYGQRTYGLWMERGQPSEEGTAYASISINALGPPLKSPSDPPKRREAYEKGALGWNAAWSPIHQLVYMTAWTPDMANPFMNPYKPRDVDVLAMKYNRTQTYFYVTDAATGKDRAEILADQFENRLGQRKQQAMMGNISTQQNIAASMGRQGEKIAAEDAQDDPEFNRIMHRKPALQRKYVALTQKMQQQMMTGKMDEAEKTGDEADRLLRSDPEMAKLMKRYDERDKRRETVAAKAQAQGSTAEADIYKQFARKTWDDSVQTLKQMAKEGYSTYIRIDCHLAENNVQRNPAKISQDVTGWSGPGFERQVNQYKAAIEIGIPVAGDSPEKVAAMHAANTPAASGKPAQAQAAAQQQAKPAAPEKKNDLQDAAKKGLKLFKKLF